MKNISSHDLNSINILSKSFWFIYGFFLFIPYEIYLGLPLAYFQILILLFGATLLRINLMIFIIFSLIVLLSIYLGNDPRISASVNPIVLGLLFLIKEINENILRYIIKGIIFSAVLHTAWLILLILETNQTSLYFILTNRTWALDDIPYFGNGLAMTFTIGMLALAYQKKYLLLLFIFIGAALTTSRIPLVAIAILFIFHIQKNLQLSNIWNYVGIILILYLFRFDSILMQESLADDIEGLSLRFTYSADRIDVYTYAFQEFLDNPFLGIGSENLDYYTHAHNSILHIAVKHGFFALIFWSLLVYRSLIRGLPFLKNLDYFGIFFLITMTQIGLHNANVLTMFFIYRQMIIKNV